MLNRSEIEKHTKDVFSRFPESERWRIFIDGKRQDEGPLAFDVKEPGYLDGALKALAFALDNISYDIIPEDIEKLHNIAISTVYNISRAKELPLYYASDIGFRNGQSTGFTLVMQPEDFELDPGIPLTREELIERANTSFQGFTEIIKRVKSAGITKGGTIKYKLKEDVGDGLLEDVDLNKISTEELYKIFLNKGGTFYCSHATRDEIVEDVTNTLKTYHEKIQHAENEDDVLRAIIECAKDLELQHCFTDANCRTTMPLLMNILLLQNGLSPAIMEDPNRIEGYTTNEMLLEVKEGMKTFKESSLSNELVKRIQAITKEDIEDISLLKNELTNMLSEEPMAALAQINHLFSQINDGNLIAGKPTRSYGTFFSKAPDVNIKKAISIILKETYSEKLQEAVSTCPAKTTESLNDMLRNHSIINDTKYTIPSGDLRQAVAEQVINYSAQPKQKDSPKLER